MPGPPENAERAAPPVRARGVRLFSQRQAAASGSAPWDTGVTCSLVHWLDSDPPHHRWLAPWERTRGLTPAQVPSPTGAGLHLRAARSARNDVTAAAKGPGCSTWGR